MSYRDAAASAIPTDNPTGLLPLTQQQGLSSPAPVRQHDDDDDALLQPAKRVMV